LGDADVLETPAVEKKKWGDAVETPGGPPRSKRGAKGAASSGKGATLTLRDQEKVSSLFLYQLFFFLTDFHTKQ